MVTRVPVRRVQKNAEGAEKSRRSSSTQEARRPFGPGGKRLDVRAAELNALHAEAFPRMDSRFSPGFAAMPAEVGHLEAEGIV